MKLTWVLVQPVAALRVSLTRHAAYPWYVRRSQGIKMQCHLCGLERPLIEAHIIPRPFFKVFGNDRGPGKVLSNKPGNYPKRVRTGFYDDSILCAECDGTIGVWDQYGSNLFLNQLDAFERFPDSGDAIAFVKQEYDFRRLRLFVLSVLWRAGISGSPMFRRVQLGPYEERLRELIRSADVGDSAEFRTVFSAFTVQGRFHESGVPLQDPFREKWNGVNAYRLSFGTVTAYIKVDQRHFPSEFEQLAMQRGRPLFLLQRDFDGSAEAKVVRKILGAPLNKQAFRTKPDSGRDA